MNFSSRDLWEDDRPKEWLVFGLVVSLLVHALVVWKMPAYFLMQSPEKKKETLIEVEQFTDKNLPITRSSKLKDQEKTDKEARFGAEFKNRVKEETRAPRVGQFQENMRLPGEQTGEEPEKNGETPVPRLGMRDLLPPSISASPNAVPRDVRMGRETLLNTDPVKFAGFFNRIAEEIYDPWIRLVRGALEDMKKEKAGYGITDGVYITKVGVWMNRRGEVTKIQVIQDSGYSLFDEAAKQAFWEREPFPHPPEQLFDKEDPIRLAYEFHVTLGGSFSVKPFRF